MLEDSGKSFNMNTLQILPKHWKSFNNINIIINNNSSHNKGTSVEIKQYLSTLKYMSLLEIIQEVLQRPDHAKENTESLMKAEKKNQICTLEILV